MKNVILLLFLLMWGTVTMNGQNDVSTDSNDSTLTIYQLRSAAERGDAEINGHEYVDLGLSVLWATCNVGASSPEDYGTYFAWGETEPKEEYTKGNSKTYGKKMGSIAGDPEYDAARANWGSTWRLPTKSEIEELLYKCKWEWTTQGGHNGYKVTGPNGKSIFLPTASWRYGKSLNYAGESGGYWGATPIGDGTYSAYGLYFGSGFHGRYWYYRDNGQSVRPVSGSNSSELGSGVEVSETTDYINEYGYVDLGLSVNYSIESNDSTLTIYQLRSAAERGDAEAQYNLGMHYLEGEGVPRSEVMAKMWLRKAAEQGHKVAIEFLKFPDDLPDESAEFPGDIYAWLAKNIKYPVDCQKRGVQGRVSVRFIINQDGSISEVEVMSSPDEELSKEAERVIKAMPKWKPALKDSKPVRMRYVLPIMFRLNSEDVPEEDTNSIHE